MTSSHPQSESPSSPAEPAGATPGARPPVARRPRTLFLVTAALLAGLLGLVAAVAPSAVEQPAAYGRPVAAAPAALEVTGRTIVGTWDVTVKRSDGVVENGRAVFAANGTVTTSGPNGTASGTWRTNRDGTVSYTTTTPTDFGSLTVNGTVRVTGDTFAGKGNGIARDQNGNEMGTATSTLTGIRR